jgi:hypothetical protein
MSKWSRFYYETLEKNTGNCSIQKQEGFLRYTIPPCTTGW